jgi:CheY-like chemotaxis protein
VAQVGPSLQRGSSVRGDGSGGVPDFLHDLANLLTAISGSLELILSRPGDVRHERWARNALEAAEQAAHLAEKHHLTVLEGMPPALQEDDLAELRPVEGPRRRIMVVDDEKSVRRTVADILLALGHEPVEAEGGAAALDKLDDTVPDLFIVDFAMPGMTGAEFALSLLGRAPEARILFMSGGRGDRAKMSAVDPEIPILKKPFHSTDLAAAVAAALGDTVSATGRS